MPREPDAEDPAGAGRPSPAFGGLGGSAALAQAMVEAVGTPLLVLDENGRVIRVNPAFSECYGTRGDRATGQWFYEIQDGLWDLPQLRDPLEQVLSGHGQLRSLEVTVWLPGGERREVSFDARHVRSDDDEVALILLSAEDVTARALYEDRIEAYAKELERSNRDLEGFAHAASHDLQEPLRKIRTYVDRLQASLAPELLDERSARYLARMPEAVERMQTRIDDLLQLARVGRSTPVREDVDLRDVVRAVLEDLEVTIEDRGAEVEVGDLPTVQADASQVRLLFQNLVSNALKFSKDDAPPRVRIHLAGPGEEEDRGARAGPRLVRIVVEDEGIGFEEEYVEKIFEPFQRLHGRAEFEGNGVGLAICRRIVEVHDGAISAEGRPGVGARFLITLPAEQHQERPT